MKLFFNDYFQFDNRNELDLVLGDITDPDIYENSYYIVNAANMFLKEGHGVCGAIFNMIGAEKLQKLCDEKLKEMGRSYVLPGQAVLTDGCVPAIIHAIGPDYRDWSNLRDNWIEEEGYNPSLYSTQEEAILRAEELLAQTYRSILSKIPASRKNNKKIKLLIPSISTGIYAFPLEKAAKIAVNEIISFLTSSPASSYWISIVAYDIETYLAYQNSALNYIKNNG